MDLALGGYVRCMRLFGGRKGSEMPSTTADHDSRLEPGLVRVHAEQPSAAIAIGAAAVLAIDCASDYAKISKSIVLALPIDMVDLALGPLTSHVKPGEAMGSV
jgi:hypothetical protein